MHGVMDQLQEERAIAGAADEPHSSRPNSGLHITLAELRMMSTVLPFPPPFYPQHGSERADRAHGLSGKPLNSRPRRQGGARR